jgi:hypothetical protein
MDGRSFGRPFHLSISIDMQALAFTGLHHRRIQAAADSALAVTFRLPRVFLAGPLFALAADLSIAKLSRFFPFLISAALLLQGDGGGQAFDVVDLRHSHLMEQTPRIGGDGFEIPPLRLRIERAEGQ